MFFCKCFSGHLLMSGSHQWCGWKNTARYLPMSLHLSVCKLSVQLLHRPYPSPSRVLSLFFFPLGARRLAEDVSTGRDGQRLQGELARRMGNAPFGRACSTIFIVCPGHAVPWQSSAWDRQPPQQAPPGPLPCKSPSGLCWVSPPAQTAG